MAFTVRDFHDLVVIMDTQPHWKAEMRRLILSDDILSLPQELRELAASVRSLSEAQKKYESRSEERFDRVDNEIGELKTDVGGLKGSDLERQFRERPFVYLNRFALRLQIVSEAEVATSLENASEQGLLTDEEVEDAKLADVIARGRNRKDRSPLYLVAEISSVIDAQSCRARSKTSSNFGKSDPDRYVTRCWWRKNRSGYSATGQSTRSWLGCQPYGKLEILL